jgi:hypothetical protein
MWFRQKTPPKRQPNTARWGDSRVTEKVASKRLPWRSWLFCLLFGFCLSLALLWQMGMVFPQQWQKDYPWLAKWHWARFQAAAAEVLPPKLISPKVVFLPVQEKSSSATKKKGILASFHYVLTVAYLQSEDKALLFQKQLETNYHLKIVTEKIRVGQREWYRVDALGPFQTLLDVHRIRSQLAQDGYLLPGLK